MRVCASHGGLSLGEDGASHQMIEDIALMRAMPRMQVIVPADYNQAYRAVIESYDREGPMYMRFGRPATPFVYDDVPETLGGGVDVLREGTRHLDLRLRPHGVARPRCRRAAAPRGRASTPRCVNVAIVKPLASEAGAVLARPHRARRDRRGAPHRRRPRGRDPHRGRGAVPGADPRRRAWRTRSACRARARP